MNEHIIDVNETDFEYQVLEYSATAPVVVEFWAGWCIPCRPLGPLLEKLAESAQGGFRLAKVDVDANPNLARRFGIRSIPAVKAFRDGQMVAEFTGVRPEPQVRQFLAQLAPDEAALLIEKGDSLLLMEDPLQAEQAYRSALELSPTNEIAALGLARSLLLQGRAHEARLLLHALTQPRLFASAERLAPLVTALEKLENHALDDLAEGDNPLDTAYARALRLVSRGNLLAALDGLLEILRQDKRYRDGAAHQLILSLLELLGEAHPETRAYRNELAQILF
jgi:putative thioredoxin